MVPVEGDAEVAPTELRPSAEVGQTGATPVLEPSSVGAVGAVPEQENGAVPVDHIVRFCRARSFEGALSSYVQSCTSPPRWNAWQSAAWPIARYYEDQLGNGAELSRVPWTS